MSATIEQIRNKLETEVKVIFLHSNADLDSVGSAAALKLFFGKAELCAQEGVSHLGKKLLADLEIEFSEDLNCQGLPVIVDAHDDSSLGYGGVDWNRGIVIDHHSVTGGCASSDYYIDENATSTSELVWEILGRPEKVDEKIGMALLAGILADTGHLRRGNHITLGNASEILRASGLSMESLAPIFDSADSQDMSRRISRLKGAQRLKFDRVGEWLVAKSEVGAFEGAVCHALLNIGADVAIVGSQNEEVFRVTGRATRKAVDAGIHLGNIMNKVSQEIEGEGGGHDGAAGLSGKGDVEAMLNICARNCLDILKKA